ncbi:S8 family peptidase [Zafaria sp. Z1313]|uniref:S8 family peptidase n=1 Tax=Zafaria sp. Z1313 TaxID=3423202 RepID=UPI003D3034FB
MRPRGSGVMGALAAVVLAAGLALGGAPAALADPIREQQYWLEDYGIEAAWKDTKGAGVKVAVIDTGVDTEHPDLVGNVAGGIDVSGSGEPDGSGPIGARPEHGTLVATMLAGHGNNKLEIAWAKAEAEQQRIAYERAVADAEEHDEDPPAEPEPIEIPEPGPGPDGVIGVAPEAQLLTVSLWLGSTNPGGVSVEEQVPKALRWAVDQGAKVVNLSLGSTTTDWPRSWDDAFLYAEQQDVVVVAAAGNRAGGMIQVGAPATIPGVLTVAGVDRDGKASWDSSTQGISIGVSAPADPLVGGMPGGGYAEWTGTSGAAPLVAGVAALIRSKHPELSAGQVVNRILATAKDTGAPGVDNLYGFGLLDADAAVNADVADSGANPLGTIAEWIRVHRRGAGDPGESSTPTAVPSVDSTVPPAAAPSPREPARPGAGLPQVLVLGGGALLVAMLAAAAVHAGITRRALRRRKAAEVTVAAGSWGPAEDGHDAFDDVPEGR